MNCPIDPEFGNHNGDNLTEDPEDEYDENAYYNWTDHPIRKFFRNPKNQFHPSFLHDDPYEPEEEDTHHGHQRRTHDREYHRPLRPD